MSSQIVDEAILTLATPPRSWSKAAAEHLEREERHRVATCVRRMAPNDTDLILEALGLITPAPATLKQPAEDGEKRCSRCGKTKPLTDFNANRASRDGRAFDCKACRKERYDAKRRRDVVIPDAKRCAKCQTTKPAAEFSRDRAELTGLTSWCKDCRNAAKRDRGAPEKEEASL